MSNQFELLTERRFLPYFVAQTLAMFNDNLFRYGLIVLAVFTTTIHTNLRPALVANQVAGIFILPLFLFSALGGQLADKFEKGKLLRWLHFLEFCIVGLFFIGFATKSLTVLLVILFFMGLKTALYGPVKYSYLPQQLNEGELIGGNAMVSMGTFGGLLLGMLVGTTLGAIDHYGVWLMTSVSFVLSAIGWFSTFYIPRTPSYDIHLHLNFNIFAQIYRCFKFALEDISIFLGMIGVAWLWFYGLVITTQLPVYVKQHLGGEGINIVLFLACFAIGIALGAVSSELLSRKKIDLRLVLVGTLGMTLVGIDLYFVHPPVMNVTSLLPMNEFIRIPRNIRALIDFILLGAFSVIYVVPLYAYVQKRSPVEQRARIIATYNIIRAFLLVIASVYAIVLISSGLEMTQIYLITALMSLIVTLIIFFSMQKIIISQPK